jgi:hypothetical protein
MKIHGPVIKKNKRKNNHALSIRKICMLIWSWKICFCFYTTQKLKVLHLFVVGIFLPQFSESLAWWDHQLVVHSQLVAFNIFMTEHSSPATAK